jgi:hypothetical protein
MLRSLSKRQNHYIRGGIQNIPDRCRHLYSSCGSTKHQSQQAKLWIPGSTAKFCGDCLKTCEDVAPNFGENRPGSFIITTPRLTLPSSPSSPPDLSPCDFFLFPKMKLKLKGRRFDTTGEIQAESQRVIDILTEKNFQELSKHWGDSGTGVYMREGTTSRVMAADRHYEWVLWLLQCQSRIFRDTPS